MLTPCYRRFRSFAVVALALLGSCAFHSTATHWNGRLNPDGKRIFVKTTTNVGVNAFVALPMFGNTSIDTMLDETTAEIAKSDSNHVRLIETAVENYWYGFPPFTWILTPVITNVSLEYEPSVEEYETATKDQPKVVAGTKRGTE